MTLKKLTVAAVVLGLVNLAPGMVKRASAAARLPVRLMVLSFDGPQKATGEGQNHQGEVPELDKDVAGSDVDDKDMENDEKDDADLQENDRDNGEEHNVQNQAGHHDDLDADDKEAGEDRDSDRDDDLQQERGNDSDIPPR